MNNPNWKSDIESGKYGEKSVEFIHEQSEMLLNESIVAIRQTLNRSYALMVVYLSALVYWFDKFQESVPYSSDWKIDVLMMGGSIASLLLLHKNFFGQRIGFRGAYPANLISGYYEKFEGDEQKAIQLKIGKIIDNQKLADQNFSLNKILLKRLKNSLLGVIVSILVYLVIRWFILL